jgi:integrase
MNRKPIDNHPAKGREIGVDPIRETKDIESIKHLLSDNPRNLTLFSLGINNGLRAGDLVKLKVSDVKHLKSGEFITIKENKTGKYTQLMINRGVHKVLQSYLSTTNLQDTDYLFKSKKGNNHISVATINHLIKEWCKAINLKGNFGSHSMRKTWAYHQRIKYGVSWSLICKRLNHSSPVITQRYLGIEDKEISGILLNNEI